MASRENPNRADVIRSQFARQCATKCPSAFYLRPHQYAAWVTRYGSPFFNGIPVRVAS